MKKCFLVRAMTEAQARNGTQLFPFNRFLCTSSNPSDLALKNVTKSNFEPALAELRGHVREADFVSIDLEMTGVTSAPWRESFEFDRSDIRYLKVKDSAEKFAVVQFGVCPFRWDSKTHSFIAHPHNFYIFPRQEIPGDGPSNEFSCQTTSLDFLARYQFDFNACIYEGISYLSRSQEEEVLTRLNSVYKDESSDSLPSLKASADTPLVRMADILFAERMKIKIGEWRAGLLHNTNEGSELQGSSIDINQNFQTTFLKLRPALVLNALTSRQLRLIELVTKKHFEDLAYVHATGETSCPQPLVVYTESTEDRDLLMREIKDSRGKAAVMRIKAAVGFRHVIDLLSTERKLIVGHNCFLDMAHIYNKFVGPLPPAVEEYVSEVQKHFPYIVDTKVLLNSDSSFLHLVKKGSTSLSKAFSLLCPQIASSSISSLVLADKPRIKVEVHVDNKRFSNWNSGAKHEAGYDAFMTGCVFAQACTDLGIDFNLHEPHVDLVDNEKLQKYINHLYLSWINGDVIDLRTGKCPADSLSCTNLKQRYPKILFSNIVILCDLPSKLKAREIKECMSKAFGADSVTSIFQLDETAAFVQFSKQEFVSRFLELKDTLEQKYDPISVLHPLSKILEGGRTRAASYEIYKEICSSPISEVLFSDQAEAVGIEWRTRLLEPVVGVANQEDKISSFSQDRKETCPINNATGPPSRCHFPTDELVDSFYPVQSQLSK